MRKIGLIISCLCLVALSSWSDEGDRQFIPIAILDSTTVNGQTHRAPAFIPVQAYYDGFLTSVCVQFLQDIGAVYVSIANLSTGDYSENEIDSSIGGALLPISGEVGIYRIVLLRGNGTTKFGA